MYNQPYGTTQPIVSHQVQPTYGRPVAPQYRPQARSFQPTGYVPSYYNPQEQSFLSHPTPQSYHLPHYVGYQADHDRPLHEDSIHPTTYAQSTYAQERISQPIMAQQSQYHPGFVTQPMSMQPTNFMR